ncbi:phosphatase PAP2 family protein [Kaistella palustris]|uniref:phosphatase PAP2 family protein n=1 Tax=Kaistella palustris TaxID=493376 RepID=UPI00042439C5|nr:phosphatase PAP2 family protein [Kaistella palustris]
MNFNYFKNRSAKLILSILFLVAAIFVFAAITDEVVLEKEQYADLWVFQFFKTHIIRNRLTDLMVMVTGFCSPVFIKIAYPFIMAVFLVFRMYKRALFLFLAGAGGLILIYCVKMFFQRPRPLYPLLYKESGYSFPSGHATFGFILYGSLAYFVWLSQLPKMVKLLMMTFLMLLSLSIGVSRIYLMVHYPSDVLAGFCLGYSWLFLLIFYFRIKYPLN